MKEHMISKLRLERLLQGKSQYCLEQETSIHQTLISLFERGYRKPNSRQKKLLAKALRVPEYKLFSKEIKKTNVKKAIFTSDNSSF